MPNTVSDLTSLTPKQLVAAHNAGQNVLGKDEDSHVKKFRDAKTGIARIEKLTEEILEMHGYAALKELEDGGYEWVTEKPPIPKTTENKAVVEAVARVGATTLDLTLPLHLRVDRNPKKNPSRAYDTFRLYSPLFEETEDKDRSVTGQDFVDAMVEAGFTRKLALSTLHWDIDHNFIHLGHVPVEVVEEEPEEESEDAAEE